MSNFFNTCSKKAVPLSKIQRLIVMVHLRRKSFVWLWIAALLTATTGVSMERIYCYCLGKTSISFFGLREVCEEQAPSAETNACCRKKETPPMPCCRTAGVETSDWALEGRPFSPDGAYLGFSDPGCTHKTTQVFQLHTEYLPEKQAGFELDYPLWFKEISFLRRLTRPALCVADELPRHPKPPPVSGRDRCVRHQIYRC